MKASAPVLGCNHTYGNLKFAGLALNQLNGCKEKK